MPAALKKEKETYEALYVNSELRYLYSERSNSLRRAVSGSSDTSKGRGRELDKGERAGPSRRNTKVTTPVGN
jgi:hypothetical protein